MSELRKQDVPGYAPETFEHDGYEIRITADTDDCGAPWDECDGHGPVSEWTRRDKLPGERILVEDRGARRYYDFAAAVKQARSEGWDTPPYNTGTPGERAHRAAARDYEYLRGYARGDWVYLFVAVTVTWHGKVIGRDSCGGIESFDDYWREHIADVVNGILADHDHERMRERTRESCPEEFFIDSERMLCQ
jgi:hypothetical protein